MTIKGILFDKDGTIVDFNATFDPAARLVLEEICNGNQFLLEEACKAIGFDLNSNQISHNSIIIAGTTLEIATRLAKIIGRTDFLQFSIELDHRFGEICHHTLTPLPGASEAIRSIYGHGYLLGIATNDSEKNAWIQMETLGIDHCFHTILGADSGYGAKPEPGIVNAFMEHTGLEPAQVLMVGDSIHDLHAGIAAGTQTCAVLSGPADRQELDKHAGHVLDSITGLYACLSGDEF